MIGANKDLFHPGQDKFFAPSLKPRINGQSPRSWLQIGSQFRCGLYLQVVAMKLTTDLDPATPNEASDARYCTDAEMRAEWRERTQATFEFDSSRHGWARCGEAVLPIAAPLVALAIMLIILVA
jgi:hypothetical protein